MKKFIMKKHTQIFNFVTIVILLALSGCAHYRPTSLRVLNTGVAQSDCSAKESTIAFDYHVFSKQDCIKYLDRDVIALGYQPVQITFTNNTKQYLTFSTANFSLPCIPDDEVSNRAHSNTKGRAAGYGTAAFFIWPLAIPAIVDGIGSSEANKKMDIDYSRKTLSDQVVKPHTTINGLIFVPAKSFDPNFKFVVTDAKNNKRYALSSSDCVKRI